MNNNVRYLLAGAFLALSIVGIVGIFWYADAQYSLPTPRPVGYQFVALETRPQLPFSDGRKVSLLHFFNPSCPCSRFNIDHVRALARKHPDEVNVYAILQLKPQELAKGQEAFERLQLPVAQVYIDTTGRIADAYGVYSTPQGVVLRPDGSVYFRGNYNLSRYCTDRRTEFVAQALEALLRREPLPDFPPQATTAYGCQLPSDSAPPRVSLLQF
jgi:hypothetical protein